LAIGEIGLIYAALLVLHDDIFGPSGHSEGDCDMMEDDDDNDGDR